MSFIAATEVSSYKDTLPLQHRCCQEPAVSALKVWVRVGFPLLKETYFKGCISVGCPGSQDYQWAVAGNQLKGLKGLTSRGY